MPICPCIGVRSENLDLHIKKRLIAKEQERKDIIAEREQWEKWQKDCKPERIICLDESSIKTNYTPIYGWAEKGKRCKGLAPGRWKTYTILSYLTFEGKTESLIFPGAVDKVIFKEFMEEILLPVTQKGDVIIMDNLNVHKNGFSRELFEKRGVEIRYIPRYSPEYNPIEMMWSKMKSDLRKAEPREWYDIWRETSNSLLDVNCEMAKNWYKAGGYCQ